MEFITRAKLLGLEDSAPLAQDGELIRKTREQWGLVEDSNPENRLWVEGMLMHFDTPLKANITLSDEYMSDFNQENLTIVIRQEDAIKNIKSLLLQPIDMRWDATGHEREKYGTSNGIKGVIANYEVRNESELWVCFVFWMNEFKEDAKNLINNFSEMGMSFDLASDTITTDPAKYPNSVIFDNPHYYGGTILYKFLAADKDTYLGFVAKGEKTGVEEKIMEFKEMIAALESKDEKLASAFRAQAEEKDRRIEDLKKQLEDKANSATASENTLKAELENTLKAQFEDEKNKAIAEAKASFETNLKEVSDKVETLTSLKTELEGKVTELETAKNTAEAALKAKEEQEELNKVLASRIEELNSIHPLTDEELTEEFKGSVAKASEDKFDNFKLQREIAKIKAGGTKNEEKKEEKEIHSSAHASFKGNSIPQSSMEELIKAFASVPSN